MNVLILSLLENNSRFLFSAEAMEERYEHKTHARIQEVVRS